MEFLEILNKNLIDVVMLIVVSFGVWAAIRSLRESIKARRFEGLSRVYKTLEGESQTRHTLIYERKIKEKNFLDIDSSTQRDIMRVWSSFHPIGLMVKHKIIDEDLFFEMYPSNVVEFWEHSENLLNECRKLQDDPLYMHGFEKLAKRAKEWRIKKGI